MNFASDVAASGRRLRILSVVDSYTRECLALEVDTVAAESPRDTNSGEDHRIARSAGSHSE